MVTIHIVRHGQVENPRKIYYGRIEGFALSQRGTEQAKDLGIVLAKQGTANSIGLLFSSPQQRTQETAAHIVEGMKSLVIDCTVDKPILKEDFNEIFSPLENLPIADLEAVQWKMYDENVIKKLLGTTTVPPFEREIEIYQRTIRGIKDLASIAVSNDVSSVLVTTHGALCHLARVWAKQSREGADTTILGEHNIPMPDHCSVISIILDDTGNYVSHTEIEGYQK